MFTDADVDDAVAAGVLTPAAASAFRAHLAGARPGPAADEEQFRLLTGFNDIFVSIAILLVLVAAGWIGRGLAGPFGAAAVAAVSWGLAEFFTRRRRMALPSIILLLAFVGGVFAFGFGLLVPNGVDRIADRPDVDPVAMLGLATAAAIATAAAWAHWRRFRVPITIAAGTAAAVGLLLALVLSAIPAIGSHLRFVMFATGVAVFAFAMAWDMSDPGRATRRSDVAFWLHLLAAPLIVHPVFTALAGPAREASAGAGMLVIALYVALGVVALAIDRRALMVSALAYVLFALSRLFEAVGTVGFNVALTALVIGSALLFLSAFWGVVRAAIVGRLSPALRRRLPPVAARLNPRPA